MTAATTWPEAAIAIAGIFLTTVISVLIWQIFETGRTGIHSRGRETRDS
jgi:hypothetical protein